MGLIDCLLLTLINAVICITLPKLLSLMKPNNINGTAPSLPNHTLQEAQSEVPSFPY
ncbi:MAG: hypothetical protein KME08_08760 [Aphanothece sp. CMT-3BRIN-NPC111]|jgi:hypothetical protein|nr:hypothetical protein [Aphanothece sp. CMT-3BRIN-NPC111]